MVIIRRHAHVRTLTLSHVAVRPTDDWGDRPMQVSCS